MTAIILSADDELLVVSAAEIEAGGVAHLVLNVHVHEVLPASGRPHGPGDGIREMLRREVDVVPRSALNHHVFECVVARRDDAALQPELGGARQGPLTVTIERSAQA